MIFVEHSAEEWKRRYPGLKTFMSKCTHCKAPVEVSRPYIERGYAGFAAWPCPCGKNENRPDTRVTTSAETIAKWANIVKNWLG